MSAQGGADNTADDGTDERHGAFVPDPVAAIVRQSMFWTPERQVVSAWIEHVPFAFWLVDVLAPETIVELGTHTGVSYSAMCQAVKALDLPTRCFAVDTWKGDEHSGHYGEEVFRDFADFHDSRYGAFSRLVRSTFDEAVGHFEDRSIDLLHVDGLHGYEAVHHDLMSWLPKLAPSAVVLLHDTNVRERGFGVSRLWAEVSAGKPHFSFLHGHGLGVLGLGHDYPEPLRCLFDMAGDESLVVSIRRVFASLGRSAWQATNAVESNVVHAKIEIDQARTDVTIARLRTEVLQAKAQAGQAHSHRSRIETQLQQASAEAEEARTKCSQLESDFQSLQRDLRALQARNEEGAQLQSDLRKARAEAEEARNERIRLQSEALSLQRQVNAMAASTAWRVAAPARAVAATLPPFLRRAMRGSAKLVWWLMTPRAIPRRVRFLRSAKLIRSHGFDAGWYLANYPDVAAAGIDPAKHYLSTGAAEGRDPGPGFSTTGYLWRYQDVASAGINPLLHHIRFGIREGRNPAPPTAPELLSRSEFFDRDWYLGSHRDVAATGVDPVAHYLATGAAEGRDPGPRFSTRGYVSRYPDVAAAGINPLLHYIQVGISEGRNPGPRSDAELLSTSEFFDRDWYVRVYADVAAALADPAPHYLQSGAAEGRDPGPRFSTRGYLLRYPDVAAAGVNPLLHYIEVGMGEGRKAGPPSEAELLSASEFFDADWYLAAYPDVAAAGLDPATHYLQSGAAEGRDPGPRFSTKGYLIRNPDVADAGVNPLRHYLRFGIVEGRNADPPTDVELLSASKYFDRAWYLMTYPDVAAAGADPVKHYLENGAAELRDPGPCFSTKAYLARHPDVVAAKTNPLLHYIQLGIREGREISPSMPPTAVDVLRMRFSSLWDLPVFHVRDLPKRVSMVTDSINSGSLYGGVGTAIIFSALLSRYLGASLRVITRTEPPDRETIRRLFAVHDIDWQGNVQFAFVKRGDPIDVGEQDLFITTSWWTTWSTRRSVPAAKICYLLQEDERMFYPLGDEQLRCREVLADPDLRFVVNSRLLFEHLVDQGFRNIAQNGMWFEPAFPKASYYLEARPSLSKMQFFFYARPHNPRNLYYRGIESISGAIESGIIDLQDWQINFVGKDLKDILLPRQVRPVLWQNLTWSDYVALVRRTDLGLALMYTPHSSYPPLDLAASGAVAVTNRYGRKQSLAHYSKNIICVDDDVDSLVKGLAEGVALAKDRTTRTRNYQEGSLSRDWSKSFEPVLQRFAPAPCPSIFVKTA